MNKELLKIFSISWFRSLFGKRVSTIYFDKAVAKYNACDYKGAIEDYTQSLEINPEFADAYYDRGNAKFQLHDYKGAIIDYTKAIKILPEFAEAYFDRGTARLFFTQDISGAIDDHTKAVKIDPQLANKHRNINYNEIIESIHIAKFEQDLAKETDSSIRMDIQEDFYMRCMQEKLELENNFHVSPEYQAEYDDHEAWLNTNFTIVKPYDTPPYDDVSAVKSFISEFKFISIRDVKHLGPHSCSDLAYLYSEKSGCSKDKATELLEDVLTCKFVYGE